VFTDAWGRPIYFLRWAPALTDSDTQTAVIPYDDSVARVAASVDPTNRDPFNPSSVYRTGAMTAPATTENGTPSGGSVAIPVGWKMSPLVYSAGADGVYGIHTSDASYHYLGDPYVVLGPTGGKYGLGSPTDDGRYDNVTNHRGTVR